MPDLLATKADLEALIGPVDTAKATLLLEAATAAVQAAAGQRIVQVVDDTITVDLDEHDGGPYLELPQWPVTAVGTVKVGSTTVTDVTAQLGKGRLWRSLGWRSATLPAYTAPSQVTVTYTHGLPPGDQRLQLARSATLMLAAGMYATPPGVTRLQLDDYSEAYAEAGNLLSPPLVEQLRRTYGKPGRSVRLVRA